MDNLRDTPIGQLLRLTSLRSRLLFPEEQEDFQPSHVVHAEPDIDAEDVVSSHDPTKDHDPSRHSPNATVAPLGTLAGSPNLEKLKTKGGETEALVIDWYGYDDPANPKNWSTKKKSIVVTIISTYTFVVYGASSIIVPANGWIMQRYGVSQEVVLLTLSIYVVGYGLGPMLFSPISEIASVGRNPPYILSFIVYLSISIILAAVADESFAGLLVLRALQAFFGSPILASGGASIDDIFSREVVPFFYVPWVLAMYAGPAIGPTLATYAVPRYWRWPLWEIVIMSAIVLFMLPFLPETSSPNILYQRAARLRATTGKNYRSKAELVKQKPSEIALQAVTIPALIPLKDPAIGFVAVYSAVIYGTYYSFFEAFPIVYPEIYGFGLSGTSLVFWAIVIGSFVGVGIYLPYLYFYWLPYISRNKVEPEAYLRAAFPSVYLLPAGLFLFAWTARESIHWIVPTLGIFIFAATSFIFFQCIICYLGLAYPDYVASLFAGNDFARSMTAAGFVMFSTPMYHNLGIDRGVSLLAGISIIGPLGLHYLYNYGKWMRSKSRFAVG